MEIAVKHLCKSFGGRTVLRDLTFTAGPGITAVMAPSGTGKTTLLRCLNFLETADSGTLVFDGESFDLGRISRADIARLRKKTAFVFQNYNLFRNKTALQNVTEGLIVARRMPKEQADEIGRRMLEKVGLADRADYYPRQLSGGQQQRVAIARALVNEPEVLLLDEPLGALDLKLRKEMQIELKRMQKKLGITLSISLHASNNKSRSEIMPVNDRYDINELLAACRYYFKVTGRRISFEYALIDGHNDSMEDARELAELLGGFVCHVNIIPVNKIKERNYHSDRKSANRFRGYLEKLGINATVRRTLGADIDAACGQLRREYEI